MQTVQPTAVRPHIVWLDVLRLIAILLVIAVHCTDPFNASPESRADPEFNFWGSVYGSALRACVPLFVMMTGFLLLPVKQTMPAFYRKRIPRVFFPFLIWSVLFDLAPWFIQAVGGSAELVTCFFPWEPNPSASFGDALQTIAMIPLTFTVYATPMWYIYALIGLYLYLPIFSAWVERASRREKRFFLLLWFVSLFIPYLTEFVSRYHFGTCSWNAFGTFYYFAGFNGYLLLGHYLGKGNDWSVGKTLSVTIPLFLVGYFITLVGFRHMTSDPNVTVGAKGERYVVVHSSGTGEPDALRLRALLRALLLCRPFVYVCAVAGYARPALGSGFDALYLRLRMGFCIWNQ